MTPPAGSPAAALGGRDNPYAITRPTASGNLTLTNASVQHQSIDANGSHRDVTLPAVEAGLAFYITNRTAATYNLVVKNAGATTLVTIPPKAAAYLHSDGTGWSIILGAAVTSQT